MAHITGGEVTFERRLKTGDYEHKHAAVKMSFSVDESEDVEAILNRTSLLALTKAHEMLGLKVTPALTATAKSQTKTTAAKGAAGVAAVKAVEKTQVDASVVEEPKTQISTGDARVDPAQVPDELDDTSVDITDAMLTDAAKTTNKRINNPVVIKAVRDRYTGKTPSILSEIPKPKRQAFLDELAKLK